MLGPKEWSLELAIQDALVRHRIPKKDRQASRRAQTAASLVPESLAKAWADILDRLPPSWRTRADSIWAFAPPFDPDLVPGAASSGRQSRRVEIPRGYHWLLVAFGNALAGVREPWREALTRVREASEPEVSTLDDVWQWVIDQTDEFLLAYKPSEKDLALIEWVNLVAANAPGAVRDEPQRDARALPADVEVEMWVQRGLSFALAHELGHHLLNHLEPQEDVAELDVSTTVISWLRGMGLDLPTGLNRSQTDEWLADAFALMVLLGEPEHTIEEFWRVTMIAGGGTVAILALFIAGELLDASGDVSRTHPPVMVRLKLLMEATTLVGRTLPQPPAMPMENGREMNAEAGLYGLQLFGAAQTLLGLHELHKPTPLV